MESLVAFFGTLGPWGTLFGLVFAIAFYHLHDIWCHESLRKRTIELLERDTAKQLYVELVKFGLSKVTSSVDRRNHILIEYSSKGFPSSRFDLSSRLEESKPAREYKTIRANLKSDLFDNYGERYEKIERQISAAKRIYTHNMALKSWTPGLLDISLLFALSYSVLVFVLQWAATGDEITLSGLQILAPETDIAKRLVGLLSLFASFLFAYWAVQSRDGPAGLFLKLGLALLSVMTFTFISTGNSTFSFSIVTLFAISFVTCAFAGSSIAFSVIFVGVFASGLVDLVAQNGPISILAVYLVVGILITFLQIWIFSERLRNVPILVVLVLLFAMFLLVSLAIEPTGPLMPLIDYGLLVFFLLLLPLSNGFADYLSTGFTRHCLKRAIHNGKLNPLWLAVDIFAGLLCFIALAAFFITFIELTDHYTSHKLLNLNQLFGDSSTTGSILNSPNNYWWLFVAFASTLVPTFLHILVWVFSIPLVSPKGLRTFQVRLLKTTTSNNPIPGRTAAIILSLQASAGVVALSYLAVYLFSILRDEHPNILISLLTLFSDFHSLISF